MNPHPNPHRATLEATINAGANIIRLLNAQAETEAQTPTPNTADNLAALATAFARAHRAVRLGILLAQQLDTPQAPAETPPTRTAARTRILRAVEDEISHKAEPADAAPLHAELRERLDTAEFEDDLRTRTPDDLITEITRDLGLSYGSFYKRRTPADLATLHATAAAPGGETASPAFAITWPPRRPPMTTSPTSLPPSKRSSTQPAFAVNKPRALVVRARTKIKHPTTYLTHHRMNRLPHCARRQSPTSATLHPVVDSPARCASPARPPGKGR